MEKKFRNGDSIILKRGGYPRTIVNDKLGEDSKTFFFNGMYQCAWIDRKHRINVRTYSQEEVKSFAG